MVKKLFTVLFLCLLIPASLKSSKEPLFDPQVTVWDRIMKRQSYVNLFRGMVYMNQGLYSRASAEFGKAVVQTPNLSMAHSMLGAALYWQGQVDNAVTEYKTAISLDKKNTQSYQLLAIAYAWKGNIEAALENFEIAMQLAPKRADIYMDMGSIYNAKGEKRKALDYFRKAVNLAPKYPLYHYQLGLLYSRMEKNEDAIKSFKHAISLFRQYQDAVLELACVYEKEKDFSKALHYFKKAVKLKPSDGAARFRYARLLLAEKNFEKARQVIEKAFALSPLSAKEAIGLSLAYGGKSSLTNTKKTENKKNSDDFLKNLKQQLNEIPLTQNGKVNLKLLYLPDTKLDTVQRENSFAQALKDGLKDYEAKNVNRRFLLPAADAKTRKKYINEIEREISSVLKQVPTGSKMNLSLDIDTNADFKDESAYEAYPSSSNQRVVYNPRNVGNDMGLWIIGSSWLYLIKDAMPSVEEDLKENKDPLNRLLAGLGFIILGSPAQAAEYFESVVGLGLKEEGFLGLAAAYAAMGSEEKSKEYTEKVLKINPKNKTALQNLKWFEGSVAK